MPAPHDDDLLWDEPRKAERVAPKRTGFRPKGYDVVADVVDDEGGSGKLLWILGGVGGGVAVLAVLFAALFWGRE